MKQESLPVEDQPYAPTPLPPQIPIALQLFRGAPILPATFAYLLPPAYYGGKVIVSLCLSVHTWGGVPISHNALQHFPECHEAAGGGGVWVPPGGVTQSGTPPGRVPGQVPGGGVPSQVPRGGYLVRYPPTGYPVRYPPGGVRVPPTPGGVPSQVPPWGEGVPGQVPRGVSRYPPWGVPSQVHPGGVPGQVPPRGSGYPPGWGVPGQVPPRGGGGTRSGQQKEYSLHGGRYASCVHAGGLSCN